MEDQILRRSYRLQNLPPSVTVDPPPPHQKRRLDTDGSFKQVHVSEVPSEPTLMIDVSRKNTPPADMRYSSSLNGSDLEQMSNTECQILPRYV